MGIESKKFFITKERLEKIEEICRKFRITLLILFGSRAKAEADIKSDLDIGVLFKNNDFTAEQEMALFYELVRLFQTDRVDLVVLNRANPLLMKEVAIFGTPLYEEKRGIFDEFQIKAIKRYLDSKKFRKLRKMCLEEFLVERGL